MVCSGQIDISCEEYNEEHLAEIRYLRQIPHMELTKIIDCFQEETFLYATDGGVTDNRPYLLNYNSDFQSDVYMNLTELIT